MGIAAIPYSEILAWMNLNSLPAEDRFEYYEMIVFVDLLWVSYATDKREANDREHAASGNQGGRSHARRS